MTCEFVRNHPQFARNFVVAAALSLFLIAASAGAQGFSRPRQEYRTLGTDVYIVSVQKGGDLNLALSSGASVCRNVFPAVWFDGEDAPERLDVDGRQSGREAVGDALGEGQGMTLVSEECEWRIRAYPGKPFFVVQAAYTNAGKKPVRVKALYPWCISQRRKGSLSLGSGTESSVVLSYPAGAQMLVSQGGADSAATLLLHNRVSGQNLVAGFLTETIGFTRITLARSAKAVPDAFDEFSAGCIYDPPLEIAPGQRVESELLYLAVGETDPLRGLERYGYAAALANGLRPTAARLHHAWRVSGELGADRIVAGMEIFAARLGAGGWSHVIIAPGWDSAQTPGQPDPARYPEGFLPITRAAHRLGLTISLAVSPFAVSADDPLVARHPGWFFESETERPEMRVIDVSVPDAYTHLVTFARTIGKEWGFDGIEDYTSPHPLLAVRDDIPGALSTVQRLRLGLRALREGLGGEAYVASTAPQPAAAGLANALILPDSETPEGIPASVYRWYFSPHLYEAAGAAFNPDTMTAHALALRALSANSLTIAGSPETWSDAPVNLLRRVLPAPPQAARPADILADGGPSLFTLALPDAKPEWYLAAVYAPARQPRILPLSALGASPPGSYTLYDVGRRAYLGHAAEELNVAFETQSLRLLALRRDLGRPMVLSMDQGVAGGLFFCTDETWTAEAGQLAGTFSGTGGTVYTLDVYLPPDWSCAGFSFNDEAAVPAPGPGAVRLTYRCTANGDICWHGQFVRIP